jgi:hypothetical protein
VSGCFLWPVVCRGQRNFAPRVDKDECDASISPPPAESILPGEHRLAALDVIRRVFAGGKVGCSLASE